MRKTVLILALLVAATPLLAADDAEVVRLRAEKEALEQKLKLLMERVEKIETELDRLRLEMARSNRSIEDRLARVEGGDTRIASGTTNNGTRNPNLDPDSSARLFTDPRPTTPTTPTTPRTTPHTTTPNTTTPNTTPTPPVRPVIPDPPPDTTTARVDLPRIPDPFLPTTPKRPRIERAKGTPTTIAVVDMLKLFNSLKEKMAIEEGLKDLIYAVKFEDQKWQRKIGELTLDLRLIAEGTPAHIEKKRQLEQARIDWNVSLAAAKTRLNRRRGELLKVLYAKMVNGVGRVADQNGYDMVLFQESTPAYEAFANVGELINTRMVVKAADSVDLTEQVIRLLNGEYERQAPRAEAR